MSSLVEGLVSLGLTEYEAKAYIALVKLGSAKVSEIHETSGVPMTRLYDVLSRLEKRGWVEVLRERPLKYRAKHPRNAIRSLLTQIGRVGEEVERELCEIYGEMASIEKPDVWLIRGEKKVKSKIFDMIGRATKSVSIALTELSKGILDVIIEYLNNAYFRGVDVHLLVPKLEGNLEVGFPVVFLKSRGVSFIHSIIEVDEVEVLMVLPVGLSDGGFRDLIGVWVRDSSLAGLARDYMRLAPMLEKR